VTLRELLAERGVKRALIVDDACDEVPRAVDLAGLAGDWANFAADLLPEQRDLIRAASPETADLHFDAQVADNRYVAAVWNLRDQLEGLTDPIFEAYQAQRTSDLEYVALARDRLRALGLECESIGRDFEDAAQEVDLIVIDLYFGGAQNEEAFDESKRRLAEAVERRRANPPLVLLMSRSERIFDRRDNFRDEVRLVDSGFRILLKHDLKKPERLDRQLERLAQNLPDTLKLARFFDSLEDGIDDAAERTLSVMRRLKLSDIEQIQQLLLDVEGEPPGSYLVDIFDRVMQHEIERDRTIIDAAIEVNGLAGVSHPAPYVAGSPQLQELVERTLTQNRERLRLPGSSDSPVTFGDLLQIAAPPQDEDGAGPQAPFDLGTEDILVVMTPICDLQHRLAPQLLLMVGKLKEIDRTQWSYGPDARTPAIELDEELRWIKWDLKHILTIGWAQLDESLQSGSLRVVARLREAHALEIQQRLLAGLGRVGLVAPMPATFAVSVDAYATTAGGELRRLDIAELADDAVVWVGRDEQGKPNPRLVLTERACDGIEDALAAVAPEEIVQEARSALAHIKSSGELRQQLGAGLNITGLRSGVWLKVPAPTGGQQVPDMALMSLEEAPPLPRNMRAKAGIMLIVREAEREIGAPSLEDAIAPAAAERDEGEAVAEPAAPAQAAGEGADPPA
jgi:hypothetical protein